MDAARRAFARDGARAGINLDPHASCAAFERRGDAHATVVTPEVVHDVIGRDVGERQRARHHEVWSGGYRAEIIGFIHALATTRGGRVGHGATTTTTTRSAGAARRLERNRLRYENNNTKF